MKKSCPGEEGSPTCLRLWVTVKRRVGIYPFFKECCFRVTVDTNPNPKLKTAFFKKNINKKIKKQIDVDPGPSPDPSF